MGKKKLSTGGASSEKQVPKPKAADQMSQDEGTFTEYQSKGSPMKSENQKL